MIRPQVLGGSTPRNICWKAENNIRKYFDSMHIVKKYLPQILNERKFSIEKQFYLPVSSVWLVELKMMKPSWPKYLPFMYFGERDGCIRVL